MSEVIACELCGERIALDRFGFYAEDAGEFYDEARDDSVLAHAQCGIDAELPLA